MRDFIIGMDSSIDTEIDTEMDNVGFVPVRLDTDTDPIQYILNRISSCFSMSCLSTGCVSSECVSSGCLPIDRTAQDDLREIAEALIQSEPHYQEVREIRIQIDSHHVIQQIILNRNTHLFYNRRSMTELQYIINTWFDQNNFCIVARPSLFEDLESYYAEVRGRLKRFSWDNNFTGGWIKFTKSENGAMKPCGFRHSFIVSCDVNSDISETSEE